MRNALSWFLAALAIALAIPALALMFASEKVGDWSDGMCD